MQLREQFVNRFELTVERHIPAAGEAIAGAVDRDRAVACEQGRNVFPVFGCPGQSVNQHNGHAGTAVFDIADSQIANLNE